MGEDPFHRLQRRLARDEAVSQVVSYTLMFGLGAVAMTFAMEVLTDAQEAGQDLAAAKQINQIAQMSGTLVQEASRAGHAAPNATWATEVALPPHVQGHNYTIWLHVPNEPDPSDASWDDFWDASTGCPTNPELRVSGTDTQLSATVRLSNLTTAEVVEGKCLVLDTQETVSSSAAALRVEYSDAPNRPTIRLEPANR